MISAIYGDPIGCVWLVFGDRNVLEHSVAYGLQSAPKPDRVVENRPFHDSGLVISDLWREFTAKTGISQIS
jgi:hypothetical protein